MRQPLSALWQRARRWISRSEMAVRWLGLSRRSAAEQQPGLILVQIDGLSRTQFERALKRRRMPFLRKLMRKRGYSLHSMYSGLPSSTPAVQGEIFYGVKCAVPAFSFRSATSGQLVAMFNSTAALEVQDQLSKQGDGLIQGGSAYCDIYSGNADESHFCASTMGWGAFAKAINPFVWLSLLVWHAWSILRTLALMMIELGLALSDVTRGKIRKGDLWKEIMFIPARVVVSIGMRELVTIGASMDATRGLPIIHLNYLGYDEQSHRRGPSSAFAHWTLQGIDDAIKRVWQTARKSQRRSYSVSIYSDHGQEKTIPYASKYNQTIQQSVANIFDQPAARVPADMSQESGNRSARAQWVGGRAGRTLAPKQRGAELALPAVQELPTTQSSSEIVQVACMGPIGHIYPPREFGRQRLEEIAAELVASAEVPLAMMPMGPEEVRAWTRHGVFTLPQEAGQVLGADHPYLPEVAKDLVCLCHHPLAGTLIISGWSPDAPAITFAQENGSHAGPGFEETRAFMLLPQEAGRPEDKLDFLRPGDLRRLAETFMRRDIETTSAGSHHFAETTGYGSIVPA